MNYLIPRHESSSESSPLGESSEGGSIALSRAGASPHARMNEGRWRRFMTGGTPGDWWKERAPSASWPIQFTDKAIRQPRAPSSALLPATICAQLLLLSSYYLPGETASCPFQMGTTVKIFLKPGRKSPSMRYEKIMCLCFVRMYRLKRDRGNG